MVTMKKSNNQGANLAWVNGWRSRFQCNTLQKIEFELDRLHCLSAASVDVEHLLHFFLLFSLTIRFHVNDIDREVIARDIVLLEIIDSLDADQLCDIEYLWDVWYNMTLIAL